MLLDRRRTVPQIEVARQKRNCPDGAGMVVLDQGRNSPLGTPIKKKENTYGSTQAFSQQNLALKGGPIVINSGHP